MLYTPASTQTKSNEPDPATRGLLRSNSRHGGLLVWEETSKQDHLADADHQKDNGLSDGPEGDTGVQVLRPTAPLGLAEAEVRLVVYDRLQGLMDWHAGWLHLSESSDSVLIGEEGRVITDLEIKVNGLVREGGELVAEAELVGAIFGCCEGKTVILLFHLFVQCSAVWVLQAAVYIIVATGYNLKLQRTLGADDDVLIETLFGVVRQLES